VNERELHRVLVRVVPDIPSPPDRVGTVIARARRQQRAVVVAVAAVLTGIVAIGGVSLLRALSPEAPIVEPGLGGQDTTPTPRADGVLETPGCVGYRPNMATMQDGTPVAPNQEALSELAMRVQPYAMSHFADVWAQAEMRPDGRLRLYRKPSAEFDAWIMRDFAAECIEVTDAKATEKEMEAWARQIDVRYWERRGIEIFTVGGTPVNGVLVVEVAEEDLAAARAQIPKRYPDLEIRVRAGVPVTFN
jgi:hypothetical protein